jgi:hypothetical protein
MTTATEIPPDIRARAMRYNEEFRRVCAPFDELTPVQREAAFNFLLSWHGSQAARGNDVEQDLLNDALAAARRAR